MTQIILLPEAEEDLSEAALFLERRLQGLGSALAAEVEHGFRRLEENPLIGPEMEDGVRRLLIRRFPYNLIYRLSGADVLVLAVAHHRRRPGYWRDRL